ncbi:hypothetical protein EVAR_89584_1 [Eumeta japonica]|uniref:Uncharacterized protein n=1 Tax=Eumeta variegata TaxID=151549 RepID=A0A4C1XM40_EUMVA|nr:hypothetical protein EVAR_89584_1 [Eumeta japonica]
MQVYEAFDNESVLNWISKMGIKRRTMVTLEMAYNGYVADKNKEASARSRLGAAGGGRRARAAVPDERAPSRTRLSENFLLLRYR